MNIFRRSEAPTNVREVAVAEQSDAPQLTVKQRVEALPLILNPRSVIFNTGYIAPSAQGPNYTEHVTDPAAVKQLAAEIGEEMLSGNRETLEQMSQTKLW